MTEKQIHPDDENNSPGAPPPTYRELAFDLLQGRFWSIAALLTALAGIGLYLGYDMEVPRELLLFGLALILLSPLGYIAGSYILSLLWSPNYIWLIDLDAREIDGALYCFPPGDFRDLEVTDGALDQLTPELYAGKNVDLETGTVEGTWRGTKTDRELLRSLAAVHECRGILEDDAREGFVIKTNAWSIIRKAVRDEVVHVVKTYEDTQLPDGGEAIGRAVDDALEEFGLDLDDLDGEDAADLVSPDAEGPEPETDPGEASISPEVTADD